MSRPSASGRADARSPGIRQRSSTSPSPALSPVPAALWRDWRWQLRNRLDWRTQELRRFFPHATSRMLADCRAYGERFKLALTPYVLSLVALDREGNPVADDPIWGQFRFLTHDEYAGEDSPRGCKENWELPRELPTRILHHKYPDRAILRVVNQCFGHCNYCYLTSRVIHRQRSAERAGGAAEWQRSLAYLRAHPEIRDVLVSGGDPLTLPNERINRLLGDLRELPAIRTIRLNTRALTFNPFRFDRDLVALFRRHALTALEIHVAHPREITPEFDTALALLDQSGHRPLVLWRAPLLAGINDRREVLEDLLVALYARRITPYYLFHFAPHALGRRQRGVAVRAGAALLSSLRRAIPGPAFPRFALFHREGKHDIPLERRGTPEFRYDTDLAGRPVVRFRNWRRRWVTYPDVPRGHPAPGRR